MAENDQPRELIDEADGDLPLFNQLASMSSIRSQQEQDRRDIYERNLEVFDRFHFTNGDAEETSDALLESPAAEEKAASHEVRLKDGSRNNQHSSRQRNLLASIFSNWWLEIVACATSFAALLALFGTLYVYRDKPSPNWPNWLSLNAIVAIYVAILKASVLLVAAQGIGQLKWRWFTNERPLSDLVRYDDASRGPMGALVLLCRFPTRQKIASCGALITVLALPTDVFAQQIIRYYECSIRVAVSDATIARTNYYALNTTYHLKTTSYSLDPDALNAVNAGLYDPTNSPGANCLTGNCTWSEYSSIGWCSNCVDISNKLTFQNKSFVYDSRTYWNLTTTLSGIGELVSTTMASNESLVNIFHEDGSPLLTTYAGTSYELANTDDPIMQYANTSILFVLAKNMWGEINPATGRPFPGCDNEAERLSWPCKGYGASRCYLYPCVKTYNASMHAGKLQENLLEVATFSGKFLYPNDADWPATNALLDKKCIKPNEERSLKRLGYHLGAHERWLPYRIEFPLRPPLRDSFPESLMTRGCLYALDFEAVLMLGDQFFQLFQGTVETSPVWNGQGYGEILGSQADQTLYNFGNVTFDRIIESFTNMTVSLTNFIRQNGVWAFSEHAQGTTSTDKACVAVRWAWIAFPSALVLCNLVFLIALISITQAEGVNTCLWKSSPLALLYHGLVNPNDPASVVKTTSKLDSVEAMNSLAEATKVKLSSSSSKATHLEIQNSAS